MSTSRYPALAGFLAATFVAGAIGSAATFRHVRTWYPTLEKPIWTPPDWLFGPAWTFLYVAMSFAVWRVWRKSAPAAARTTVTLYVVQLALNAMWSVLFFGLQRPDLALAEILLLWGLLVGLLVRFARIDRPAGVLWLLYVGWVTFALALNAAIWRLNA